MIDYQFGIGFWVLTDENWLMSLLCNRAIQESIIRARISPESQPFIAPNMPVSKYRTHDGSKKMDEAMHQIYGEAMVYASEDMSAFLNMLIPSCVADADDLSKMEASDVLGGHTPDDIKEHEYAGININQWLLLQAHQYPTAEELVESSYALLDD